MSKLKEILYNHLKTMTLQDYNKYVIEEMNGYIKINSHPEDENIRILNYTEKAVFERRWNHETMTARGLIVDLTEARNNGIVYILALPFEKFFNYGEFPEYEKDLDFNKIVSVMEKMDGSLGISYFINDEIRFATRGSFTSEQAKRATKIWKDKYSKFEKLRHYIYAPVTYLVEIIYPDNRIVVDYGDREELVLIGVIYLFGEKYIDVDYDDLKWEAGMLNMPVAEMYDYSIETMLKMKKSITANEEGWIIKFSNNKRLKIKGDEYLDVHRVLHGLSTKAKFRAWADGTLEAMILMMPEEFRKELEDFEDTLDRYVQLNVFSLQMLFDNLKNQTSNKKEFAQMVNTKVQKDYRGFLFGAYKTGQIQEIMIKEHIAKNYKDYEEVVTWMSKLDS